ncbi:hypothetical protein Tco_1113969 [Tanacetum coccineum]|uniref:Uncharacterized protein n=1 Tax=Tanacetum coccineum TaxID=301880 RepID=A0ABQ5IU62_9ASTR
MRISLYCLCPNLQPFTRLHLMTLILKRIRRTLMRKTRREDETCLMADPSAWYLQYDICPSSLRIQAFETVKQLPSRAALPSSSPPPENVESLKDNIRETMTTVDQGMSVEEIERVVAQRVANAIEAIAIYETKTNMARKSMSQTKQQECKVAENANNKRKWEGNHNGEGTVKGGNYKKIGHMTRVLLVILLCRNINELTTGLSVNAERPS